MAAIKFYLEISKFCKYEGLFKDNSKVQAKLSWNFIIIIKNNKRTRFLKKIEKIL
jgi:hypothetical protein